ncbi:MAG: MBL fold metallo-hydrolase, partial [bacterium]
MVKFIVAGSASGVPVPKRSHACLVLGLEERFYLLDVGEGGTSSLLRCGVDHHQVATVFISHMHPDHCTGLPMLLQMMYLAERTAPLEIYLPREGVTGFTDWLPKIYIFPEKLPFPFKMSPILPGLFFQDEHIRLSAFANEHLHGYRPLVSSKYPERTLESYSLVIEWEGKRAVYSGDISSLHDLLPHSEGADLLFLEATHVGVDEIIPFVAEQDVKRTVLVHIPPELEGREDRIRP